MYNILKIYKSLFKSWAPVKPVLGNNDFTSPLKSVKIGLQKKINSND